MIYTFCDGNLIYKMGLTPKQIVGRELIDFVSEGTIESKINYFHTALKKDKNAIYEGEFNGIHYFASLQLICRVGQEKEVIGTCIEIPERN